MPYNICTVCGRFFDKAERKKCPKCHEQDEKYYERIREYIVTNTDTSVMNISRELKIPSKTILRYVKEGSFTMVENGVSMEISDEENQGDKGSGFRYRGRANR